MEMPHSLAQSTPNRLQKALGRFLTSEYGDAVARTLPGRWLIIAATAVLVRSQTGRSTRRPRFAEPTIFRRRRPADEAAEAGQLETLQQLIFDIQASIANEEHILRRIVKGVVEDMHYLGAMVATYKEEDDTLPVRSYYMDRDVASEEQIHMWEMLATQVTHIPLSLSDESIARVLVHEDRFATNLSVRAYKSRRPVKDTELISLFRPVVPDHKPAIRCVIKGIQIGLGVKEVIAVPFFRPIAEGDTVKYELIGNLFALTTARSFSGVEVQLLQAFGQQAAAGLKNARLYHNLEEQRHLAEEQRHLAEEQRHLAEERERKAEEQRQLAEGRRQSAEIFGKMAFNAATNVHDLTNHIGLIRMQFNKIIRSLRQKEEFSEELLEDILQTNKTIDEKFVIVNNILKNLHDPWHTLPDVPTDINKCLENAIRKLGAEGEPWLHLSLRTMPLIQTSPAMLSEAFRVMIKNAIEAMDAVPEEDKNLNLWIRTRLIDLSNVEITIRDSGIGIKQENIDKIFEMGWSTKETGLGFGLFWAKDFIEEGLNGKVNVESVIDQGTTFHICIPCNGDNVTNSKSSLEWEVI